MAKQRQPGYVLPHNPLAAAGVLDELKKLKGDKAWLQFELELLTAQYPDNTTFKAAIEHYTTKAVAATTPPEQADKVTPATDATPAKASTKGNGNKPTTSHPGPKAKATNKKEGK